MLSFGEDGERFLISLDSNVIVRHKHFRLEINERMEYTFHFLPPRIYLSAMYFCLEVE